jgi:hypothetical protein
MAATRVEGCGDFFDDRSAAVGGADLISFFPF